MLTMANCRDHLRGPSAPSSPARRESSKWSRRRSRLLVAQPGREDGSLSLLLHEAEEQLMTILMVKKLFGGRILESGVIRVVYDPPITPKGAQGTAQTCV